MIVAVNVQDFLAFDTENTILLSMTDFPNFMIQLAYPDRTHSVRPGSRLAQESRCGPGPIVVIEGTSAQYISIAHYAVSSLSGIGKCETAISTQKGH